MLSYEIAVLRILLKKRSTVEVSSLVDGFPDNSEANVLEAISNLYSLGYIAVSDSLFPRSVSLNKSMRLEALRIVDPSRVNEEQSLRDCSGQEIVNPGTSESSIADNEKSNTPKLLVMTKAFALAFIVLGSTLVVGNTLFHYLPAGNNQNPADLSSYHQSIASMPSSYHQSIASMPSITPQKTALPSFVVATIILPTSGPFQDRVFMENGGIGNINHTFHSVIIDYGNEKTSGTSTLYMFLRI